MSIINQIKPLVARALKDLYGQDPIAIGFNEPDLTVNITKPEFEGDYTVVLFSLIKQLKKSFIADYVVLGGGNAKRFERLPEGIVPGHNRNAFLGGVRLWEMDPRTRREKWRIV
jgi:hypothetical protein